MAIALLFMVGAVFAVETPVVRGSEKAVVLTENVEGVEEVKLVATIGPDTYDYDQAIWCAPMFVLKDGSRVDATTLELRGHAAGWGKVEFNRVNWSRATVAKVGGEQFTRFIAAHAPSYVVLPVPQGAVRFEARCGLTSPKGKGSCTFRVEKGEFTRSEKIAELATATRTALPAIERLLEHRKASNPELAPKLGGVAARAAAAPRGDATERVPQNADVPAPRGPSSRGESEADAIRARVEAKIQQRRLPSIPDGEGFVAKKAEMEETLLRGEMFFEANLWGDAERAFTAYIEGIAELERLDAVRKASERERQRRAEEERLAAQRKAGM